MGKAEEMRWTDADAEFPQQPEQQRRGVTTRQAARGQHGEGTVQLSSKLHRDIEQVQPPPYQMCRQENACIVTTTPFACATG
jgi:hypothetical protein